MNALYFLLPLLYAHAIAPPDELTRLRDDLARFPTAQQCRHQRALCEQAQQRCVFEAHWRAEHVHFWYVTHIELRCCDRPWEVLGYARDEEMPLGWRRKHLADLRNLIGPVRYGNGYLPPAVPPELAVLFR